MLLRSLDPDPARRQPDVESLAADLADALPPASPTARARSPTRIEDPPTVATDAGSPPERRGVPVLLTLICLLVLAATFAGAYAVTTMVR